MTLRSGLIASLVASISSRIRLVHGGTSFSSSCDDFLIFRPEIRQIWEQSFLNRPVWLLLELFQLLVFLELLLLELFQLLVLFELLVLLVLLKLFVLLE